MNRHVCGLILFNWCFTNCQKCLPTIPQDHRVRLRLCPSGRPIRSMPFGCPAVLTVANVGPACVAPSVVPDSFPPSLALLYNSLLPPISIQLCTILFRRAAFYFGCSPKKWSWLSGCSVQGFFLKPKETQGTQDEFLQKLEVKTHSKMTFWAIFDPLFNEISAH